MIVYACDVGSTKSGSFGWARVTLDSTSSPRGGENIEDLILNISSDLDTGRGVSIGFEAPLYMPVPNSSEDLSSGRKGEGSRSMFAPAGGYVTTLACHQAAYILRELSDFQSDYELTLNAEDWIQEEGQSLLVWEAFVSEEAHAEEDDHKRDAATAAVFFRENDQNLEDMNAVTSDSILSVIGSAALWAGWTEDTDILHEDCLVLRPSQMYNGEIQE